MDHDLTDKTVMGGRVVRSERENTIATSEFVDSVKKDIVDPGVQRLMALSYFTELRAGKLSKKRLLRLGPAALLAPLSSAQGLRPLHG